jgi:AcrR family transcriptional regulator
MLFSMNRVAKAARPARRVRDARRKRVRLRLDTDERRAQLVALGLEQFGTRSYDDVSIDEIAAAAGISKGLLYHYFPTKKAYYAAVVREAARELLDQTEMSEELPPLERLHQGLDAFLSYVRAHAHAYATLMKSGVGVDPEIARIVDETRSRLLERLTTGFADASPVEAPLVKMALRGWVGFAEASALGWIEAIDARRPAPSQKQIRNLLAATLVVIVQAALKIP